MIPAALSLTGSGHLLIYQLGACRVLMNGTKGRSLLQIKQIAGSSGGAISAALLAHAHRQRQCRHVETNEQTDQHEHGESGDIVDEYSRQFIRERGRALTMLKDLLASSVQLNTSDDLVLSIATTRCDNGKLQMFHYRNSDGSSSSNASPSLSSDKQQNDPDVIHTSMVPESEINDSTDNIIDVVNASCRIPSSSHPVDIISNKQRIYAEHEGVQLGTHGSFVDGGIAAPAPPTSPDLMRIVVTPLVGKTPTTALSHRISPSPEHLTFSWPSINLNYDLSIPLICIDNLRALRMSMDIVRSSELEEWFLRGQRDAESFLDELARGLGDQSSSSSTSSRREKSDQQSYRWS